MFPLSSPAIPTTTPELIEALAQSAVDYGVTNAKFVAEGAFPKLDTLRADFSGTRLKKGQPRPKLTPAKSEGGFFVRDASLLADPLYISDIPASLKVSTSDAVFAFGITPDDKPTLVLQQCNDGALVAEVSREDLLAGIRGIATNLAEKKGVGIKSTEMDLTADGKQALKINLTLTAKAMMMTAKVNITGRAMLDDEFNLKFSNLQCTGEGMAGNMAAGLVRPFFEKFEGKVIPLAAKIPQGLNLSRPSISVGEKIVFRARFKVQKGA